LGESPPPAARPHLPHHGQLARDNVRGRRASPSRAWGTFFIFQHLDGLPGRSLKSTTGQLCPPKYSVLAPPFPTLPATDFQFLTSPTLNQQQLYHGDTHHTPHHTRALHHHHHPSTLDYPRHHLQKIDIGFVNPRPRLSDLVTSGSSAPRTPILPGPRCRRASQAACPTPPPARCLLRRPP